MGDFFQIVVISQSTEILIKSNCWLGMYVPYTLILRMLSIDMCPFFYIHEVYMKYSLLRLRQFPFYVTYGEKIVQLF